MKSDGPSGHRHGPASLSFYTSAPTSPGTTGDQSHPEKLTPDSPLDSSHDKLPLDIPFAVCVASRAHWPIHTNTSIVISDPLSIRFGSQIAHQRQPASQAT